MISIFLLLWNEQSKWGNSVSNTFASWEKSMIVMNHFPLILVLHPVKKVHLTPAIIMSPLLVMVFVQTLIGFVCLAMVIDVAADDKLAFRNSSAVKVEKTMDMLEDKIIRKLERLRRTMPVGNPNSKIPVLDPYVINNVTIDYDMPNFRLKGLLDNVKISGLKYFYVNNLELHILPAQIDLDLTFPALEISGDYNLKGKISRFIPIFGKGSFTIKVHRILIENYLRISLKAKYVKVVDFGLEPSVDGFQIKITGIFGSHVVSKIISDVATKLFSRVFQMLQMYIGQKASTFGLNLSKMLFGDDLTTKEIIFLLDNDNDGLLP